jgi:hypothetical protein
MSAREDPATSGVHPPEGQLARNAATGTVSVDQLDAYAAAQMPRRTPGAGASAVVGHTPLQPQPEPRRDAAMREAT